MAKPSRLADGQGKTRRVHGREDLGVLVVGKLEVHGGAATLRCLDCSGRLGHAVHHQPLEEASRDACHSQDSSQHNRDRLKRV